MIWSALVKTALLGTDRTELSAPVKAQLAARGIDLDEEPARVLLSGAALWHTLRRAALPLPLFEGELTPAKDEKSSKPLSIRSVHHLDQILTGDYVPALQEFMDHLVRSGKHLPAEHLPALFDRSLNSPGLWTLLQPAIGERGRWLLIQNPYWRPLWVNPKAEDWETARRDDRLAILRYLRGEEPSQAVELLQQTWDEESTEDRAAFLQTLRAGLSMADEPFLEACLDDRRQEVRQAAADLLSRLPDSRLAHRFRQRLDQYTRRSEKGELLVTLPEELDSDLRRDGLSKSPPDFLSGGRRAGWLGQVIMLTPPGYWTQRFGLTPTQVVRFFQESEWADLLLSGLCEAVVRHDDVTWAEAVVQWWLDHDDDRQWQNPPGRRLLETLPEEVFNRVAVQYLEHFPLVLEEDHLLPYLLSTSAHSWNDRLSVLVVKGLQQKFWERSSFFLKPFHYHRILENVAYRSSPQLFDTFKSGWNYQSPNWPHWERLVDRFLRTLRFRREMIAELEK